jgi:hypothetical protein
MMDIFSIFKLAPAARKKIDHLPEFTRNYLDTLEAQINSIFPFPLNNSVSPDDAAAVEGAKKLIDICKSNLKANPIVNPTWGELMQIDLSIIRALPNYHLQLKVADLRQRVSTISYSGRVEILTPTDQPDKKDDHQDLLRAEAALLSTRLWQVRKIRYERECMLKDLVSKPVRVAIGTIFLVFLLVIERDVLDIPAGFVFMITIFCIGVVGALMSILRRVQRAISTEAEPDLSRDFSIMENQRNALLISLYIGGVFALLLFFLFTSKIPEIMSPALTPGFYDEGYLAGEPIKLGNMTIGRVPSHPTDFAKCFVWAFISGFSEQFVPDVLDRLVNRDKK